MDKYKYILISIFTLTVVACGQTSGTEDTETYSFKTPTYEYPSPTPEPFTQRTPPESGWNISKVRIKCDSGDCPEGVGLVIFVSENYVRSMLEIKRCTGTLIDSTHMITNAHCTPDLFFSGKKYFVMPNGDGAVVRKLSIVESEVKDKASGTGRDLAVWLLQTPVTELKPRKISRRIPENMDTIIHYVINSADSDGLKFSLDKKVCRTRPRIPVINGGTEDLAIGISLYDCFLQQGNSGSPGFVPGDMESVQVVMNTIWNDNAERKGHLREMLENFYFDLPYNSDEAFAMSERVQCLEVKGQASPETKCETRSLFPLTEAAKLVVRDWYAQDSNSVGMMWDVTPIPALEKNSLRMVAIPTPLCMKEGWRSKSAKAPQARYYRVGFEKDGKVAIKFLNAQPFDVEISKGKSGYSMVPASTGLSEGYICTSDAAEAYLKGLLSPRADIPVCKGDEIQAKRDQALNPGT